MLYLFILRDWLYRACSGLSMPVASSDTADAEAVHRGSATWPLATQSALPDTGIHRYSVHTECVSPSTTAVLSGVLKCTCCQLRGT